MKKWMKAMATICAVAVAGGMFVGCGNDAQEEGITVISVGDIPSAETDPRANQICMDRIAAFEKNNPDIRIQPDTYVFAPDTYIAMAEAGTLPTTYHLPFTQANTVMDMGYAEDVTDAFKNAGIYDKINDTILEKISRNGKIYLIPETCYDSGMVLNVKLFREAGLIDESGAPVVPKTWEELVQTAKTIKEKTGKTGFAMQASGWRFMNIAWSYGGEFLEKDKDGKWKAIFDSPEITAALQYVKDLKWEHNVIQENILADAAGIQQLVGSGEAAMMFGEPITASGCIPYGMKLEDVGMMQMPAGSSRHVTLIGGTYSVIKKGATEKEKEAVMRWLTQTSTLGIDLTDETKENVESQIMLERESDVIIGAETITPWNAENPVAEYRKQKTEELANINLNYVKSYNNKEGIEFHDEPPVAASQLYRTIGNCIQEVLTNKDADCAAVLKQAAADFQKNQLDNLK